jgi:transposase
MIDYQTYCQIRQMRDQEKMGVGQIARALKIQRSTVRKWAGRPRYEQRKPPQRPKGGKLEAFKGTVVRLLNTHPYTVSQLLVRLREQGYTGCHTVLKDYVRVVRPRRAPAFLTLHFAPGQCAQVDWGSAGTIRVGNTRRRLSFFAMVLCHSRLLYVEFTLGQGQEHWQACHQHAFEAFGGLVPREIMVDNCKTAVLSHPVGGPAVLNPKYMDFAGHYGFTIKPCAPRKANEKGRVENAIGYIRKNFLAGLELTDYAALAPAVSRWLQMVANVRNHGETKRRPLDLFNEEERGALRPAPATPYDSAVVGPAPVSARCRVTVETNRYSVPAVHASRPLTLKLYADRLRLYAGDQLVAEHVRSYERHRDIEHPDHAAVLLHERHNGRHQKLLLSFLALSPQAQAYHEQLSERRLNARHHIEKIVALGEIYGRALVARAVEDAHELGAYSCEYITNLLEQRQRRLPEAGALHLTRPSDLLDLELPTPDLSLYQDRT